jgi:hypothetical protein
VGENKARGKSVALIGAGALLVILAVVGVGGFFAVNWLRAKPAAQSGDAANGITTPANPATLAPVEIGRYWLEVAPPESSDSSEPTRVAGAVPLASGQAFKFHFQFAEAGYLYIVGPGDGNRPMAFLTLYPADISGLDSNLVTKSQDFSFPNGSENWIGLDKKPGAETYTIIFSPGPITEPAFLREPVTRKPLSDSEQAELASFLAKHKTSDPVTELNDKDGKAPFVAVKLPPSNMPKESGAPIAFEVRIQHK